MDGKGTEAELTHESKRVRQKGVIRRAGEEEKNKAAGVSSPSPNFESGGRSWVASKSPPPARAHVAKPFSNNRNRRLKNDHDGEPADRGRRDGRTRTDGDAPGPISPDDRCPAVRPPVPLSEVRPTDRPFLSFSPSLS